jgi:RNA polymerase sigma factor (sigma-70 family)
MKLPFGRGRKSPAPVQLSPEEQLAKILNELYRGGQSASNDLVEWMDKHLRANLKAIMFRVFGPQVTSGQSLQFTELWNDVLVRVMNRGMVQAPHEFTVSAMTKYFSAALANQARDYLRRRKLGEQILNEAIKPLVEQRERHLLNHHQLDFGVLLEKAQEWAQQGEQVGNALLLRYVDGCTYEEIAVQLSLSRDQVKRLLDHGRRRLKEYAMEVGL